MIFDNFYQILGFEPNGGGIIVWMNTDQTGRIHKVTIQEKLNFAVHII